MLGHSSSTPSLERSVRSELNFAGSVTSLLARLCIPMYALSTETSMRHTNAGHMHTATLGPQATNSQLVCSMAMPLPHAWGMGVFLRCDADLSQPNNLSA